MQNTLVTGASGLLGTHILFELTSNGKSCLAVYRSEEKLKTVKKVFQFYGKEKAEILWQKIRWIQGDLSSIGFLDRLFEENFDEVYHAAAMVSFFKSDFENCLRQNREVTADLVNFSLRKGIRKFGYVSSTAAIGKNKNGASTEKDLFVHDPSNSGYAISKYGAEKEVWRGIEEGLNAVIVNPCLIIGAGDWRESSMTILRTVERGLRFYPTGANAVVDARDVATVLFQLMESEVESERYLCIGENLNFQDLFNEIAKQLGKTPPTRPVPYRLSLIYAWYNEWRVRLGGKKGGLTMESVRSSYRESSYNAAKIQKELNFTFWTAKEMLENAIAFHKNQA
jgi:dihydroflavonol-4-reductase